MQSIQMAEFDREALRTRLQKLWDSVRLSYETGRLVETDNSDWSNGVSNRAS